MKLTTFALAAGTALAITPAFGADVGGSVSTLSEETLAASYGRSTPGAYWTQPPNAGVPGFVRDAYAATRDAIANPIPAIEHDPIGRSGGYEAVDNAPSRDAAGGAAHAPTPSWPGRSGRPG
jgi:hypothetical protein